MAAFGSTGVLGWISSSAWCNAGAESPPPEEFAAVAMAEDTLFTERVVLVVNRTPEDVDAM